MYETMSISTGLYPNLDLWNADKLHYNPVRMYHRYMRTLVSLRAW